MQYNMRKVKDDDHKEAVPQQGMCVFCICIATAAEDVAESSVKRYQSRASYNEKH